MVILLSAPAEILGRRLASAAGNPDGKTPGESAGPFSPGQEEVNNFMRTVVTGSQVA